MLNYIIYLTTIYIKRANSPKNKTKKVCHFFVYFINVTLNLNSTLSLYLNLHRTHTPLSSTVQVNCTVPHLCRVHKYSAHKHLIVYTTYTVTVLLSFIFGNAYLKVHIHRLSGLEYIRTVYGIQTYILYIKLQKRIFNT